MQERLDEFVKLQKDLNERVEVRSKNIMLKYVDQAKDGSLTPKEMDMQKDIAHLISMTSGLVSQVGYLYMFLFSSDEETKNIN